jgi:two-component system response regulator GlrR
VTGAGTAHVLLVDDDVELCELLAVRLEANGYRVSSDHTTAAALQRVGREHVDAILLDLRMGNDDGLDVLDGIRKRSIDVPVVILTAHGSIDTAVEATRRGAFGFVTKPFQDVELLQKIRHAVESFRLRCEVANLRRIVSGTSEEDRLLGVSAGIEHVREIIARVAPTKATVLITGESGTGKELVARAIHDQSQRSSGPFVAVNCAALSPELLESTLFGHTKGAFTGAVTEREGLFGAARKGTIFLDEVGETPPAVQAKLLRVLQDRRYTKVGSSVEQEADVRVVAATNRDLRQEVLEKRFRDDLFYRLHVVPLAMPPLRQRGEDIVLLTEVFLERAAARHGVPVPRLSGEALAALERHPFPGNVRELANVVEAAVLLCTTGEISVEQLEGIGVGGPVAASDVDNFDRDIETVLRSYSATDARVLPPMREARDAFERAYVDTALARASGNVALAAKLAGRNRTDFYDLLRRHGRSASGPKRGDPKSE